MRTIVRFSVVFIVVVLGIMLVGCGGGGGGGGLGGDWCADASSCPSLAGRWYLENTIGNNSCGDSGTSTYYANVTQSGCLLDVAIEGTEMRFSGKIDGNRLCWTGSYPDSGGTMTVDARITLADDALSGSGTLSWDWRRGGEGCGGLNSVQLQLVP